MQVLALDKHKKGEGLSRLTGFHTSPHDNWISNGNAYINNHKKKCTDLLPLKKTTY
jgi:hypothetical protein